ncbi:MAG: hypothetical protein AAF438_19640 [Pseudomonadota bacterium]
MGAAAVRGANPGPRTTREGAAAAGRPGRAQPDVQAIFGEVPVASQSSAVWECHIGSFRCFVVDRGFVGFADIDVMGRTHHQNDQGFFGEKFHWDAPMDGGETGE